jgi:hypothetical protein
MEKLRLCEVIGINQNFRNSRVWLILTCFSSLVTTTHELINAASTKVKSSSVRWVILSELKNLIKFSFASILSPAFATNSNKGKKKGL